MEETKDIKEIKEKKHAYTEEELKISYNKSQGPPWASSTRVWM